MKILHNPRCSKSRESLKFLSDNDIMPEVILYMDKPLTQKRLREIIDMLGIKPIQLVRKSEKVYKEKFKNKELSDKQWIKAMVDYPKLMQRPIIIDGNQAVIGRPAENILTLLGNK